MGTKTPSKPRSVKKAERDEAIARLKKNYIKPGHVIYTVLRHVGRMGMTRYIDLYVMKRNEPLRITWDVAKALEASFNKNHHALLVHGCGSDVGYDTVYNLGWALFQKPYALSHRWM